jgi:hypothetical protein
MPIREYTCHEGHETVQRIELGRCQPLLTCSTCGKPLQSIISRPAVVRIGGEGVSSPYGSELIKEPYWRDQTTGKVTSMY